ncbi:uncharacterized protein LOC143275537 [Babylonia areolata]|uniref:uncharacterized protein LOC143275537 n=1 Tax=Babylonia areolata TaxID=304850 RepID=UPI003FD08255
MFSPSPSSSSSSSSPSPNQPGRRQSSPPRLPLCRVQGRSRGLAPFHKRRHSWKEEPGWLPNPLDSDSEHEEELVVSHERALKQDGDLTVSHELPKPSKHCRGFSHSSLVPSRPHPQRNRSSDSPSPHTDTWGTDKAAAWSSGRRRQRRRRRCNSEPCSGTSNLSTCSRHSGDDSGDSLSSACGAHTKNPPRLKWSLVNQLWKTRKTQTASGLKTSYTSENEEKGEEWKDLERELEWLVTDPESHCPEGLHLPGEDTHSIIEDLNLPLELKDTHTITENPTAPQTPTNAAAYNAASSAPPSFVRDVGVVLVGTRWRREHELEWLYEPEWNNTELGLFWNVLKPHLESLLLKGGDEAEEDLPDPRVDVRGLDSSDPRMVDRCLLHVQRHIWKGNYRQAIADFRAVTRHFRSCAVSKSALIEGRELKNDVEILRMVFCKKRPSRYRLWI